MKTLRICLVPLVQKLQIGLALSLAFVAMGGCGSGSSTTGSGGGQQSSPDFSLSLSPASVAITGGGSATVTASVTGLNSFASTVTLQISGLPSGVTYSPSSLQVNPGSSLQITLNAATNVSSGTANLNVTGVSGTLTHSARIGLAVTAISSNNSPKTFRTRYTRTDAATEYFTAPNSSWMVYDPPTSLFFVTDPGGNRVEVLDATKEAMIGSVAVPGAYGIDEAPDHSVIYVGTQIGDVYAINPVTMQVTKRYLASQIGTSGYQAFEVRVLANGELALLGGQGGIPGVDGYNSIGIWNPSTNALTVYNNFSHLGAFTLTGDHSLIVVGGLQSPGGFCTLDPNTGNVACANSSNSSLYSVATTPDGKSILLPDYSTGQVLVFNARTLTQTTAFAVKGDLSSSSSMIVSPDSQTLYIGDGAGILYAYNIASGAQIGWMPNLVVEPISGGTASGPIYNPSLQAFDSTGLLAGPMEEGVGFLDTSTLETGPVGSEFSNDYLVPATGPTTGGTQIEFEDLVDSATMSSVYLGGNSATSISQGGGEFYATTPGGSAGPADLYALTTDGGMLIVPEAFSYGPTILEVTSDAATAEAGGTGFVYGYGFGSTDVNSAIPADLKITVGGKQTTVTGYAANAYGVGSAPFNLQAAAYTIPAGTAGSSADVVVTTPSGSATASAAMQYLPAVQNFALSGAQLAQGIYDAGRDLYYFTDASQIRVFSRSQGQWLSSIQVPAVLPGTAHRLWGIALSPDGSKLAVTDSSLGLIYLIDPDSPGSVKSFPAGINETPVGIAVSDTGMAYFVAFNANTTGSDGFFKLDTNSGMIKNYGQIAFTSYFYKTVITSDDSTVYFNNDGAVFKIDTATDDITYAADGPGCCYGDYDLTLSANQVTLEATSYLYDTNLNAESYLALNDREALNINYVYGNKLSSDGTLLFQPSINGIDVFDGRLGTLRERISLPFALSENYDALVSDGKDNVLVAITGQTGTGIAVVDLSSVTEPAPLPYMELHTLESSVFLPRSKTEPSQRQSPQDSRSGRQIPMTTVKHVTAGIVPYRANVVKQPLPAK